MKQKTYGILTAVLSVILICTLGIRILIPMAGASEPDTPQLGDVYRNGDYTGYFGLSQDIPAGNVSEAKQAAAVLGLADESDPEASLTELYTEVSGGLTVYRFAQTFEGLPVYGREIAVIGGSDGMALTAAGSYASVGNPGTTPSITEEEAMAQAVSYGEASWPDAEVSCTPDASSPLVIWPDESGGGRLAYLGQLLGEEAGEILIDAGTGDVLAYSCAEASADADDASLGSTDFSPDLSGYEGHNVAPDYSCRILYDHRNNVYKFTDPDRNLTLLENLRQKPVPDTPTLKTETLSAKEITKAESGEWPAEEKGVYIYLYANMAYDFFLDVLDRRGYDGNNGAMFLLYNYKGGLYENSNARTYLSGRGTEDVQSDLRFAMNNAGSPNVVSHEYTHAVTMSICGTYSEAAVMESLSDLFAELIEAYYTNEDPNWEISGTSSGRKLKPSSPNLSVVSKYYYYEASITDDAYANCTVSSHAMCRAWEAWRSGGLSVQECVKDMALLLYRSMFLLENDSSPEDFAYAVMSMAMSMAVSDELTEDQYWSVVIALLFVHLIPSSEPSEIWDLTMDYRFQVLSAESGTPLPDVELHYWQQMEDGTQLDHRTAVTDAQGFCTLSGLRKGTGATLTASYSYYEVQSVPLDSLQGFYPEQTQDPPVNQIFLTPVSHDSEAALQSAVKDILIPAYGILPNETSYYESLNSNPYYGGGQTLVPSERLTGILFTDLYDYDGDGDVELLSVRAGAESYETSGESSSGSPVTFYIGIRDEKRDSPLGPYDEDAGYELAVTDELSFSLPGFSENTPYSSVHFARGEAEGQPCLYVNYFYNMNASVFGTLQITYSQAEERLLLVNGAECSEFAYSAVCDTVSSESALESLGGRGLGTGREGWTAGREYNWENEASGTAPAGMLEGYRNDYAAAMARMGLSDAQTRSFHLSGSASAENLYRWCFMRPSEHLSSSESGPLTDLGGVVSSGRIFTDTANNTWHMELSTYDACGYLDQFR